MPRPASLLLVRHGQSEWNAVRRWQGLADSPLTKLGRQQAHEVGRRLADGSVATELGGIWSSDLRRAFETASIISSYLDIADVVSDERLREADAGPWQGLTPETIESKWPGYLAAHRRPDGFEPADVVASRAVEVCSELLQRVAGSASGAPIVAVTHSGFIRVLRRHLGAGDLRIPNLGGTWLHLDGDGGPVPGPLFAPVGRAPVSGIEGPGEDPGDESEDRDGSRGAERRLSG